MEVTQRVTVAGPPDQVWAFLSDVRSVAQCVPGLEVTEERSDGTYAGRFAVKVGPVSAKLDGEGRLERDDQTRTATIEGKGVDKRGGSRAKGVMRYAVIEDGTGSAIEVHADMTLSGPLAQIGRTAIIEDVARALTKEFAVNLEKHLSARPQAADRGNELPAGNIERSVDEPTIQAKTFDAGRAVSRGLWDRLGNWLKRLFGRK